MADKEKIVELLQDVEAKGFWNYGTDCHTGEKGGHDMTPEDIADYLVENSVTIPVRCKDCKHLNVLNKKEIYAYCPKTNTVFRPFDIDTREHFCRCGERKDNG